MKQAAWKNLGSWSQVSGGPKREAQTEADMESRGRHRSIDTATMCIRRREITLPDLPLNPKKQTSTASQHVEPHTYLAPGPSILCPFTRSHLDNEVLRHPLASRGPCHRPTYRCGDCPCRVRGGYRGTPALRKHPQRAADWWHLPQGHLYLCPWLDGERQPGMLCPHLHCTRHVFGDRGADRLSRAPWAPRSATTLSRRLVRATSGFKVSVAAIRRPSGTTPFPLVPAAPLSPR